MNRLALTTILAVLVAPAIAGAQDELAADLDYGLSGFVAVRGLTAWDLPVSPVASRSNTTQFFEYRARVEPSLQFGTVGARSRIFLSDGVLAGNNGDGVNTLDLLEDATSTFDRSGDDADSIGLDRLWLEWESPVGLFRAGRMGSQWGLGIAENGADELEWGLEGNGPVTSGDTFDRLAWTGDLSRVAPNLFSESYLLGLLSLDSLREGDPDFGDDDAYRLVGSLLLSDRESPSVIGNRELGVYAYWLTEEDSETDVGFVDVYGRLSVDLSRGITVWGEAEGFVAFGSSTRKGAVSREVFGTTTSLATAAYTRFYEAQGLDPDVAASRASSVVRLGATGPTEAEALAAPLTAALEQEAKMSADTAAEIAEIVSTRGLRSLEQDSVDVSVLGGAVSGGVITGPFSAGVEVGGTGDLDADTATPPAVVGVGAGSLISATAAVNNAIAGDLIAAGLTGTELQSMPFDAEFDPAVILFEEVGPLGANGRPTVANAWYQKLWAAYQLTDDVELWGALIYGKLATSVRPITVICDEPVQCQEGDPRLLEVVRGDLANDLGFELDAGVVYQATPWLKAEAKGGYLFAGEAFGPEREDVTLLRVQAAVEF